MNAKTLDYKQVLGLLNDSYLLSDLHLNLLAEGTYKVTTRSNDVYIVKTLKSDQGTAYNALVFQQYLYDAGLPVPAVVPNQNGKLVTKQKDGLIVVLEYCEGTGIGWGEDTRLLHTELTKGIALIVSQIHRVSLESNLKGANNQVSDLEKLLKKPAQKYGTKSYDFSNLDTSHLRKIMIHGDLTRDNILVSASRRSVCGIIDFGDAHNCFLVYDIAILLTQVYVSKTWGIDFNGIQEFLTFYVENNSLKTKEYMALLPLMEARNILLILEIGQLIKRPNHPAYDELLSIKSSAAAKLDLFSQHSSKLSSMFKQFATAT